MLAQHGDTASARRLWLEAMEQEAMFQYDSADVLLRAAQRADPGFFPAHVRLIQHYYDFGRLEELRDWYTFPSGQVLSPQQECLAAVGRFALRGMDLASSLVAELVDRGRDSACSDWFLLRAGGEGLHLPWQPQRWELLAQRLTERAPELPESWAFRAAIDFRKGRFEEGLDVLRRGRTQVPHALLRVEVAISEIMERFRHGDTTGARLLRTALRAAVARDGRPGVVWRDRNLFSWSVILGGFGWGAHRGEPMEAMMLAARHGQPLAEANASSALGRVAFDVEGDAVRALAAHDRGVQLGDSLRVPWVQATSYNKRGRMYAKMGRFAEAERDLHWAIRYAELLGDPYVASDSWHNLAHVHEGKGDWSRASHAADRFIAWSGEIPLTSLRVMSFRDAGLIRWKAGWHGAANEAFRNMVEAIDVQSANNVWAGEYFERTGNLAAALKYYRAGRTEFDRSLAEAGLVRVFEALGQIDSAMVAAERHDRLLGHPLAFPLRPGLLVRHDSVAKALAISRAWAVDRERNGNVQGAAQARLHLADLLLTAGRPGEAMSEAKLAGGLARQLSLTEELIASRRMEGVALVRLGRFAEGIEVLASAAALMEGRSLIAEEISVHTGLGNAHAGAGNLDAALASFGRAASVVERVTHELGADAERTGYRERHLAPYDGAMRALLPGAVAGQRVNAFVAWAERRKAAVLRLGAWPSRAVVSLSPASVFKPSLLAQDEVVLDYVLVQDEVAAIVAHRDALKVVRLPLSLDSLRRDVDAVSASFHRTRANRVDLARARVDRDAARRLALGIIGPVLDQLRGRRRLVIVPDGVLHRLPFDVLPYGPAGRYLIEEFEISYAPSLWAVDGDATVAARRATDVVFFDGGAPGSEQEGRAIASAWRSPARTFRSQPATEAAVRGAGRSTSVLHFAAHALASEDDPLATHLRLNASQDDDGLLHVNEIVQQRLAVPLVVLSACETVHGRLVEGEGPVGLARAFLSAGASSVVATLWPVGPSAAVLMPRFYAELALTGDPGTALRNAKLALLQHPATSHPFHWAGWVMVRAARSPAFADYVAMGVPARR